MTAKKLNSEWSGNEIDMDVHQDDLVHAMSDDTLYLGSRDPVELGPAARMLLWSPERPIRNRHKLLGSDGFWHLSECLLVEHVGSDYRCTCLDWYP